jgi:pSer/pThr/pTyr-binding forkhead associated (FHA) protein
MAKLILSMDGLVLKEIPLDKERMSIGRKASNDIQIDNLAISGEHAAVVTILSDSFLEDLNSTNGTLVNGQPVKKHFLKNGDVIELGKYKLKYVSEVPQQVDAADFEKTMVLRPGALKKAAESPAAPGPVSRLAPDPSQTQPPQPVLKPEPPPAAPVPPPVAPTPPPAAPTPPPAAARIAAIQILNGANAGRELELTKTLTTLGKPGVQVAVIARRPHGYFITHVEGAQFPVINGQAIDAQAHQLADHDVVEIAGTKMEFFLKT